MTMRLLQRTGDLISDSSFQPVHSLAVTEPSVVLSSGVLSQTLATTHVPSKCIAKDLRESSIFESFPPPSKTSKLKGSRSKVEVRRHLTSGVRLTSCLWSNSKSLPS